MYSGTMGEKQGLDILPKLLNILRVVQIYSGYWQEKDH